MESTSVKFLVIILLIYDVKGGNLPQNYPKSEKFVKALCKNSSSKITFTNIANNGLASVGEFPFQVALGYKNAEDSKIEYKCGGSLIADDIVITAAHCVNRRDSMPVTVKLGCVSLKINL